MSNSKTTVTVRIDDRQGELEIVDGSFRVINRGYGMLKADLKPGIYKARARAGNAQNEELFEVEPNAHPFEVPMDTLFFESPIPLNGTSTTHEYHQDALMTATKEAPHDAGLGTGASVLLSVRDPSDASFRQAGEPSNVQDDYRLSFKGFRLTDPNGHLLLDCDAKALHKPDAGFALLNLALQPGRYALIHRSANNTETAMPIMAVPGWQTQVFIHVDFPNDLEAPGIPNLENRSVMMAPLGEHFQADDQYFRLTEIARYALRHGRATINRQELELLLQEKFQNPIYGLFGAHLLMLEDDPNRYLLDHVTDNLAGLIGDHFPDVMALRYALAKRPNEPFEIPAEGLSFPPLLQASWNLIAENEGFYPKGSFMREIAGLLKFGGVWLNWQPVRKTALIALEEADMRAANDTLVKSALRRTMVQKISAFAGTMLDKLKITYTAKHDGRTFEDLEDMIADINDEDDASRSLELLIGLAGKIPWEAVFRRIKSEAVEAGLINHLTDLQKSLLPTLQLIGNQLSAGEKFSLDDLQQLRKGLNIPLPVLRESLEDLWKKLLQSSIAKVIEKIADEDKS